MPGAQHGAIGQDAARLPEAAEEGLGVDAPEDLLAEIRGHGFHVGHQSFEVGGMRTVVGPRVHERDAQPVRGEVEVYGRDPRMLQIAEVHVADAAVGNGRLVLKTAGLAEIPALGLHGNVDESTRVQPRGRLHPQPRRLLPCRPLR